LPSNSISRGIKRAQWPIELAIFVDAVSSQQSSFAFKSSLTRDLGCGSGTRRGDVVSSQLSRRPPEAPMNWGNPRKEFRPPYEF
jgi:hypothetical protein